VAGQEALRAGGAVVRRLLLVVQDDEITVETQHPQLFGRGHSGRPAPTITICSRRILIGRLLGCAGP
jgi:hypothetical protein